MLSDEQRFAATFALQRKGSGLFLEPGVGKTHTLLAIIEQLRPMRTVIFCKITNRESTWVNTIKEVIPWVKLVETMDDLRTAAEPSVLLVNLERYTSLKRNKKLWTALLRKLRKSRFDLVAIDESQSIKSRSSASNSVICKFKSDRRVALTGTPMDQHPSELWSQMKFIEPEAFGTSWKEFDLEYLEQPSVDPYLYPPGSAAFRQALLVARIQRKKAGLLRDKADEFNEILADHCIYIDKSSLNLPEAVDREIPVELSPAERVAYDQMEKHSFLKAGGSIIKGALAITKNIKLAQIPGGYILDEDGELHSIGGFSKARELEKWIPRLRRPFVVFALYRHEIELIHSILVEAGLETDILWGQTEKKKARPALIAKFQANELDSLVVQNRTGGVGVDLFEASDAVIYSQSHSRIDDSQMRARLERRGQVRKMRFLYLVAQDTLDADKRESIRRKIKLTSVTLERLKKKYGR